MSTNPGEHLIVKHKMLHTFGSSGNDPEITTVFHIGNPESNCYETRSDYQISKFRIKQIRTKHLSCAWACLKCSYMTGFWAFCGHGTSVESHNPSDLSSCVLRVHLAHAVGDMAGFWKYKPFKDLVPKRIGMYLLMLESWKKLILASRVRGHRHITFQNFGASGEYTN